MKETQILLVEDEEKLARFVELELLHEGYNVTKSGNGREALDLALQENYDLILLDPPYAENFLENALKTISEIDILANDGIIITERSADRPFAGDFPGLTLQKDRRYGTVRIRTFVKSGTE